MAHYVKPSNITSAECLSTSSSAVPTVLSSPRTVFSENFKKLMEWSISKELAAVRDRLKDIYAELDQTSRGEDRYVLLITQEHKVLKDERRLAEQFNRCEQEERENFSTLSSAVKESHEKERIQAERTKYWSIIGSIIGTMIGIAGSSINNEFKMRELRKLVRESAQATIQSRQDAEVPKDLLVITSSVKELSQQLANEQVNILQTIKENNSAMVKQLEQVQKFTNSPIYVSGDEIALNIDQLLETQRKESRILAIVCLSSVVCMMLVSKVFG
ncbi:Mitochondrial potassium channel [Frankliniella fusca]|uniref:Mitochondrial potassium channel n=1 Tax=Frankliniella fusca TaxID=407009 RepID=A0AAE1LRC3_9NEOP|nr:Mitochondrial potassium channel [Frankliniella fusca]